MNETQVMALMVILVLIGLMIMSICGYSASYEKGYNEPRLICISETEAVDLHGLHYSMDCTNIKT